ncbi:MAG: MFS transporter [Sphingobacteriales bacterium]|nr:MAG: MFS transporter [Sphingobacteriales bacterium]
MKNKSAILRLFAANTISGAAQGISMLAVPWYFADVLQKISLFNAIYAVATFISLFWGLYAGTLIDHYSRKGIFLAENMAGALVLLSIALTGYIWGSLPVPLVALVFLTTFFNYNIHYPALYAFAQEISSRQDYSRITSYLEIQGQFTNALAGGLAALLLTGIPQGDYNFAGYTLYIPFTIKKWSLHQVFLLDGLTYLVSFLLILTIKYTPQSNRHPENLSIKERFKIGIGFLNKNPLVFLFGNFSYFVFVTTMVLNFVLMPNFVKNYLHASADAYAIGDVAFAVGAIVSGLFVAKLFSQKATVKGNILMAFLSASAFCILIFNRQVGIYYLMAFLLGLANAGARIMRVTYLFNHIPNQIIGRTSSVFQVINVLMRFGFIGLLSGTFFVNHIQYSFLIMAALCIASALALGLFYRRLIELETTND